MIELKKSILNVKNKLFFISIHNLLMKKIWRFGNFICKNSNIFYKFFITRFSIFFSKFSNFNEKILPVFIVYIRNMVKKNIMLCRKTGGYFMIAKKKKFEIVSFLQHFSMNMPFFTSKILSNNDSRSCKYKKNFDKIFSTKIYTYFFCFFCMNHKKQSEKYYFLENLFSKNKSNMEIYFFNGHTNNHHKCYKCSRRIRSRQKSFIFASFFFFSKIYSRTKDKNTLFYFPIELIKKKFLNNYPLDLSEIHDQINKMFIMSNQLSDFYFAKIGLFFSIRYIKKLYIKISKIIFAKCIKFANKRISQKNSCEFKKSAFFRTDLNIRFKISKIKTSFSYILKTHDFYPLHIRKF